MFLWRCVVTPTALIQPMPITLRQMCDREPAARPTSSPGTASPITIKGHHTEGARNT